MVHASLVPSYSAGSSINLSLSTISQLGGSENLNGSMIYNGVTYSLLAVPNTPGPRAFFNFQSIAVVPSSSEATITITAPFIMTGMLSATDPSAISLALTGQGIASITLVRNSNGTYSFDGRQGVRYDFIETPEPATLVLLATGLTGVCGLIKKRQLKKRDD